MKITEMILSMFCDNSLNKKGSVFLHKDLEYTRTPIVLTRKFIEIILSFPLIKKTKTVFPLLLIINTHIFKICTETTYFH